MKDTVSNKIKYFNYFFTLCMVLYHSYAYATYNVDVGTEQAAKAYDICNRFCVHSGFVTMIYFFMMSGFLLYNNMNTVQDAFDKMKRRCKTLLCPFIVWQVVVIIYYRVYYHVKPINTSYDVLKVFFTNPIVAPMWYMLALFLLMLPAPLFVIIKNKNKYVMMLIFILLAVSVRLFLGIQPLQPTNDWWWWTNMLGYMPCYFVGCFVGMFFSEPIITEKYNSRRMAIVGLLLLIVDVLLWHYASWTWFRTYSIIEIVGLWLLLESKYFKKTCLVLGATMFTYAMHQQIWIPIVEKHLVYSFGTEQMSVLKYVVFSLFKVFVIAVFSYNAQQIFKAILPSKVYELFTGGR